MRSLSLFALGLIAGAVLVNPGISHFGTEVGDIDSAVTSIRSAGGTIGDRGMTPANVIFARMRDPAGVDVEVMEFGPGALQRKAMEAWDR